jgi:hypothetical protein
MNNYDLCLYGHLTVDRVFTGFSESLTLGALANVWYAFTKINPSLKIKLNPISLGEAIVLVNCENSQRIGRANLNIKERKVNIEKSKWHHIMYLNHLKDLSFINHIDTGTISADISAGGDFERIIPFLNKIDFLFISDEDLFMDVYELSKKVSGKVILHYPSGSLVVGSDGEEIETQTSVVDNLDVLGAGDIFAASFISSYMESNELKKSIEFSHQKTTEILMEKKSI